MTDATLHDAKNIAQALEKLAQRIVSEDAEVPALIGIHTNGVPLARRLADLIARKSGRAIETGTLDITLYRDDLAGRSLPQVKGSDIGFDIEGRRIVLVDDVLFTGRTVRAALNELSDFGRPRRVQLCVLVDRGHRELPICADFAGMLVNTHRADTVRVELAETGAPTDRVVIVKKA